MPDSNVFINRTPAYPLMSDSFESLITNAKAGDESALTELYERYFEKIFRFVYYRVGHKETGEDLTEDVFLKAFKRLHSITEAHRFEGWLYRIAKNTIIDHYRKRKSTVAIEEIENTLEYETNLVDIVNLQTNQIKLLKTLKQLPAEQQIVLKLKFFEQLENPEIAELLHKSEGAIRVIQHRGLTQLRTLLGSIDIHS